MFTGTGHLLAILSWHLVTDLVRNLVANLSGLVKALLLGYSRGNSFLDILALVYRNRATDMLRGDGASFIRTIIRVGNRLCSAILSGNLLAVLLGNLLALLPRFIPALLPGLIPTVLVPIDVAAFLLNA